MSENAEKLAPEGAFGEEDSEAREESGRFPVADHRADAILPPAVLEGEENYSLEAIASTFAQDARVFEPPASEPELESGPISAVFPIEAHGVDAERDPDLIELRSSMAPPSPSIYERAELDVADMSLRLDNPYSGSSLVPPPPKPFPWARAALTALGLVGATAAGVSAYEAGLLEPASPPQLTAAPAAVVVHEAEVTELAAAPVAALLEAEAVESVQAEAVENVQTEAVEPTAPEPAPVATRVAAGESETAAKKPAPSVVEQAPVKAVAVEPAPAPSPVETKPAPSKADEALKAVLAGPAASATAAAVAPPPANEQPAAQVPAAVAIPQSAAADAPAGVLPEAPNREQIVAGFESVRGALQECAGGKPGVAKLDVTIASSGRVSHAMVDGDFGGSAQGSCMARAVRKARFPAFSRTSLKVNYPFAL